MRKIFTWIGLAATVLCVVLLVANPKIEINKEHLKIVVVTKKTYHSWTMTYSDGLQWSASKNGWVPVTITQNSTREGYHFPTFSTLGLKFGEIGTNITWNYIQIK